MKVLSIRFLRKEKSLNFRCSTCLFKRKKRLYYVSVFLFNSFKTVLGVIRWFERYYSHINLIELQNTFVQHLVHLQLHPVLLRGWEGILKIFG